MSAQFKQEDEKAVVTHLEHGISETLEHVDHRALIVVSISSLIPCGNSG
jgi:hypothetical protein